MTYTLFTNEIKYGWGLNDGLQQKLYNPFPYTYPTGTCVNPTTSAKIQLQHETIKDIDCIDNISNSDSIYNLQFNSGSDMNLPFTNIYYVLCNPYDTIQTEKLALRSTYPFLLLNISKVIYEYKSEYHKGFIILYTKSTQYFYICFQGISSSYIMRVYMINFTVNLISLIGDDLLIPYHFTVNIFLH